MLTREASNNLIRSTLLSKGFPSSEIQSAVSNPSSFMHSHDRKFKSDLVEAYRRGFKTIFIVCGALAALATVLALFMMPQVDLEREDDKRLEEESFEKRDQEKPVEEETKAGGIARQQGPAQETD